jgi:hypothetical protein
MNSTLRRTGEGWLCGGRDALCFFAENPVEDQSARGYNEYQAEVCCLDNYDLYTPDPGLDDGWDQGFEDHGYDYGNRGW